MKMTEYALSLVKYFLFPKAFLIRSMFIEFRVNSFYGQEKDLLKAFRTLLEANEIIHL